MWNQTEVKSCYISTFTGWATQDVDLDGGLSLCGSIPENKEGEEVEIKDEKDEKSKDKKKKKVKEVTSEFEV